MNDGAALMRNFLLWGVPFAVVVVALGYETNWGRDVAHEVPAAAASAPQPVAVALLPEYRIDDRADARKETVARELFNPTRRPGPPATQASAPSNAKHGLYLLTGTTVIGNVATAFLREVNGGKSHTVHSGETLNGVTVAEVKSDRVRLKQGDDVEELQLKIATGPRVTTQVAVPVPAAGQPFPQANIGGATPARGGSNRAIRPVAPPTGAPVAAAPRPGTVSVGELLAERRRAARAAAQAAAGAQPAPAAQ